jgi:hypothetical protein
MLIFLAIIAVFLIPAARIVSKAGYSGWLGLLWLIPIANIVLLWVFAFSRWPALRNNPAEHFS